MGYRMVLNRMKIGLFEDISKSKSMWDGEEKQDTIASDAIWNNCATGIHLRDVYTSSDLKYSDLNDSSLLSNGFSKRKDLILVLL